MQNYANLDALSRKALLPYDLRPLQQTSPHKSKPGMVWVRVYGWHFDGAARTCLLEASQSPQSTELRLAEGALPAMEPGGLSGLRRLQWGET